MGPRLSFVVSLVAACGIHAVVLLAPRAAVVKEVPIPTVVLDLAAPREPAAAAPVVAPTAAPSAGPVAPLEPVAQQEAPAPVAVESESPVGAGPAISDAPSAPIDAIPVAALPAAASAGPALPAAQRAAPVLIPPRPRSEILPTYPRSARRAGLEGVVKVTAMVDASGVVTGASVLESSGHASLDQAALEAVRRALFAPALQDATPAFCRVVIPIRFQLRAQENAP